MDLHTLLFTLHLLGFAFGVGGATASDLIFLRTIKDGIVTKDEFNIIKTVSGVVWASVVLVLFSGLSLIALEYYQAGSVPRLGYSFFQMKLTVFAILVINGIVFHTKVFPLLKGSIGGSFRDEETRSKYWLFGLTGGISVVSWYSAFLLAAFSRILIEYPYLLLLNAYVLLVAGAAVSAFFVLNLYADGHGQVVDKLKKLTLAGVVAVVLAGMLFGGYKFITGTGLLTADPTTHEVCINEAPPWFRPDVLEIEAGDTVLWHHCDEGYEPPGDSSFFPVLINQVSAHSDDGDDQHAAVHTHPILGISGPEEFSSDFRPVGHLDDGNEFRHTFTEPGVYEYICPTHPYMRGIIAVDEPAPKKSLWPPEEVINPELLPPPALGGIGEIWLNTQFQASELQVFPGTITIIDAATWEITDTISHESFNNPHNLWHSYDNRYVFQTQWHSDNFSKIDVNTREVIADIQLGNTPAHLFVHPHRDRVYVTINNEARVAVLNQNLEHIRDIETSFGPHGIWIDPSGKWMSIAATLEGKLDIIDLDSEEVVSSFDAPGLPLATAITHDGKYAMISLLLENKVRFVDLETMEVAGDVEVGSLPVWPSPGPNGDYVFVPNTGTNDISVIALESLEVVATIPAAGGAHGIIFGAKADGSGHYGYFSNKYARVMGIVDVDELELAGYVQLPETAWGGNGILTLPNAYDAHIRGR